MAMRARFVFPVLALCGAGFLRAAQTTSEEDRVRSLESKVADLEARLAGLDGVRWARPPVAAGEGAPATVPDGSDAPSKEKQSVTLGDCRITFLPAKFEAISVRAPSGAVKATEEYLVVRIVLRNLSATRKLDCLTWRGRALGLEREAAGLTDEFGNVYLRIVPRLGETIPEAMAERHSLRPGDAAADLLIFEKPVKVAKRLTLELAPENVGGRGKPFAVTFPTP